MKLLVLCVFELQDATERDRRRAMRELESAGFQPVGFERTEDGLCYGHPNAAIGEFRAAGIDMLRSRIDGDLKSRFAARGLVVEFTLCIKAEELGLVGDRGNVAV